MVKTRSKKDHRGRCKGCGETIEDSAGKFVANFHYCLECSEGRDFSNQHQGVRDSHRARVAVVGIRKKLEKRVIRWRRGDGEEELREKFPDVWERVRKCSD